MTVWEKLRYDETRGVLPPDHIKVRAIDVEPYHWAVWCTVGDNPNPFCNAIVGRKWSEDGQKIWFMLDTHNFMDADPDEVLELVPEDPNAWGGPSLREKWAKEAEGFAEKRPSTRPCGASTRTGTSNDPPPNSDFEG